MKDQRKSNRQKFFGSFFQKRTESLLFEKRSKNFYPILPPQATGRHRD
jgi:hypothetical protein